MKRINKKIGSTDQKQSARDPRVVPLMVPHGCAEAGRDFESAFDVLQSDARVHELWRDQPAKASAKSKVARAS